MKKILMTLGASLSLLIAGTTMAEPAWPSKPIKVVVS